MGFTHHLSIAENLYENFGLTVCHDNPVTNNTVYFKKDHVFNWKAALNLNTKTISFPSSDKNDVIYGNYQELEYDLVVRELIQSISEWPDLGLTISPEIQYKIDRIDRIGTIQNRNVVYYLTETTPKTLTQLETELRDVTHRRDFIQPRVTTSRILKRKVVQSIPYKQLDEINQLTDRIHLIQQQIDKRKETDGDSTEISL